MPKQRTYISLEPDLLQKARVLAAMEGMSLTAFFGRLVETSVADAEASGVVLVKDGE